MDNFNTLQFLRAGGETKRFHSVLTLKEELVGQHSFGVAWLCWLLTDKVPRVNLIMAALAHDLAESVTGDIPAPTKRYLNIRPVVDEWEEEIMSAAGIPDDWALTATEQRVLALADAMDGMLFCVRERSLGNRTVSCVYSKFLGYVKDVVQTASQADILYQITTMWEQYDA